MNNYYKNVKLCDIKSYIRRMHKTEYESPQIGCEVILYG